MLSLERQHSRHHGRVLSLDGARGAGVEAKLLQPGEPLLEIVVGQLPARKRLGDRRIGVGACGRRDPARPAIVLQDVRAFLAPADQARQPATLARRRGHFISAGGQTHLTGEERLEPFPAKRTGAAVVGHVDRGCPGVSRHAGVGIENALFDRRSILVVDQRLQDGRRVGLRDHVAGLHLSPVPGHPPVAEHTRSPGEAVADRRRPGRVAIPARDKALMAAGKRDQSGIVGHVGGSIVWRKGRAMPGDARRMVPSTGSRKEPERLPS